MTVRVAGRASRDVLGRGLRVLGQAIRTEPRLFVIGAVGSSLFGVLVIVNSYVVGYVIGHVVVPAFAERRVTAATLGLIAAAFIGISLLRVMTIFARRLGAGYMQFRLQARYRRAVTRRYLALPPSWHQRHATGSLLSNANSDVEAAFVPIAPLPFAVGTIVMIVVAVGSLFVTDWVLALVGVTLFPMLFLLNLIYARRMSPRQIRAQRLRAKVSAVAHESFDGALVVKTMGREASESQRFGVHVSELRDALISVGRLRGLFDPVMDALPSVGTLAVLLLGAWRLRTGELSVAELVSVAFLFTVLAFPVRAIGWVVAELPRSVAGWERVQAVLGAEGDLAYGSASAPGGGPAGLVFDQVSFAYAEGPRVLHDVSFTVPAGRTVALVGATGSGKSTIASLAVRLVDPVAGRIAVEGVALPDLSAPALAATTALVPQIPFVFDDTVRGNITLDREDLTDDDAWGALRLAQADGFVAKLPEGLDTPVGERGTSLSGGQRQRLTLARALAGHPRLLVLDDATSAVDPRVEAAILGALRDRSTSGLDPDAAEGGAGGASILVVAYRRATIALADEVVFLDRGRVVATGPHHELMETVPAYNALVTAYERAEAESEINA